MSFIFVPLIATSQLVSHPWDPWCQTAEHQQAADNQQFCYSEKQCVRRRLLQGPIHCRYAEGIMRKQLTSVQGWKYFASELHISNIQTWKYTPGILKYAMNIQKWHWQWVLFRIMKNVCIFIWCKLLLMTHVFLAVQIKEVTNLGHNI